MYLLRVLIGSLGNLFVVIGWGNYCGFGFTTLISKALYCAGKKKTIRYEMKKPQAIMVGNYVFFLWFEFPSD